MKVFRFLVLMGMTICCVLPAFAAGRHVAWFGDANNDGVGDVIVSPAPTILPLPATGIIAIPSEQFLVFCGVSSTSFEECSVDNVKRSGSWERYKVYAGDFNGDGVSDYFFRSNAPGRASIFLLRSEDGDFAVGKVVASSVFDDVLDVSDSKLKLSVSDVNQDGVDDIRILGYGNNPVAIIIKQSSDELVYSGVVSELIQNGLAVRGEIKEATIPGKQDYAVSVSPTGQLSVSIPLNLPKGITGDTIPLTLTYSSGSRNEGVVGMGWTIGGMPAIQRCSRSLHIDGKPGDYRFNDASYPESNSPGDVFCGQHGRLISTKQYSVNSKGLDGPFRYAGASQNWLNAGAEIVETLPDGSYYTYEPHLYADNDSSPSRSETLMWAAKNYVNKFGNRFSFSYIDGLPSLAPETIEYQDIRVDFNYELINAPLKSYGARYSSSGVSINRRQNRLLSSVTISIRGEERKAYSLGYTFTKEDSSPRLRHVQQCGTGENQAYDCLPALTLSYSDGGVSGIGQSTLANGLSLPVGGKSEIVELDYDGDGKLDILVSNNGVSQGDAEARVFLSSSNYSISGAISLTLPPADGYYSIVPFDRNADGKQGILFMRRGPDKPIEGVLGTQTLFYETYPPYEGDDDLGIPGWEELGIVHCEPTTSSFRQIYPGFNFKCTKEIKEITTFAVMDWWYKDSGQTGSDQLVTEALCIKASEYQALVEDADFYRPIVADWRGLNRDDVVLPKGQGCESSIATKWWLYRNTEASVSQYHAVSSLNNRPFGAPVNFDGDGIGDLLVLQSDSDEYGVWNVRYSFSGEAITVKAPNDQGELVDIGAEKSMPIDLNADGRTDLLKAEQGEGGVLLWRVYFNSGNGFMPPVSLSGAGNVYDGLNRRRPEDFNARIFDYDGNSYPDVLLIDTEVSKYIVYQTLVNSAGDYYFREIDTKLTPGVEVEMVRVGDFNADGKVDIAELHQDGVEILQVARPESGLLVSIDHDWPGLDDAYTKQSFQWARPLVDGEVYQHDYFNNSENRAYPASFPVVKASYSPDGVGGTVENLYSYDTFVLNKNGRGLLGVTRFVQDNTSHKLRSEEVYVSSSEQLEKPYMALRNRTATSYVSGEVVRSRLSNGVFLASRYSCQSGGEYIFTTRLEYEAAFSCSGATTRRSQFPETLVSRETVYDAIGGEVRSTRTSLIRDDRGTTLETTVETGYGTSSDFCVSATDCLDLARIDHEAKTVVNPSYSVDSSSGPLVHFVDQTDIAERWINVAAPVEGGADPEADPEGSGSELVLEGLPSGVIESELRGDRQTTTKFIKHAEGNFVHKIIRNFGSDREAELTTLFREVPAGDGEAGSEGWYAYGSELDKGDLTISDHYISSGVARTTQQSSWDTFGFPLSEQSGAQVFLEENYELDRLTSKRRYTEDGNGLKTQFDLNFYGWLTGSVSPDGSMTGIDYSFCVSGCSYASGAAYKITTGYPDGSSLVSYRDVLGRDILVERTAFDGGVIRESVKYDFKGRLISRSQPSSAYVSCESGDACTTIDYSEAEGKVTTTTPGGGIVVSTILASSEGGTQETRAETVTGPALDESGGIVTRGQLISWHTTTDTLGNVIAKIENSAEAGQAVAMQFSYDPSGNMVWSRINQDDRTVFVRGYDVDGNAVYQYEPSTGVSNYKYSIASELLSEKHHGLQSDDDQFRSYSYAYDELGRKTSRSSDGVAVEAWFYDQDSDGNPCGQGYLCESVLIDGSFSETYSWNLDALQPGAGQIAARSREVSPSWGVSKVFDFSYGYTSFGAPETVTYPNDEIVSIGYQNGLRHTVTASSNQLPLWKAVAYGPFDMPEEISLGNGVVQVDSYDADTGRLQVRQAYLPEAPYNKVQNSTYAFDSRGRMRFRTSSDDQADIANPAKVQYQYRESFKHDAWNRLTASEVFTDITGSSSFSSAGIVTNSYDVLGNPTNFAGQAQDFVYEYGVAECASDHPAPGPHAVRKVSGVVYCYNEFGELVSAGARSYGWSALHTAPVLVSEATVQAMFLYGPNGQKLAQKTTSNGLSSYRYLAGDGYEEDVSETGVTRTRIHIGDFAVTEEEGGIETLLYTFRDHLGSVEVVLDSDATDGAAIYDSVISMLSFSPFGARRDSDWIGGYSGTPILDDGYTGHQMLDHFALVHMTGRVYDPAIGRFLSPDVLIPAPYFSQSYNRYSYVMNGPMTLVDPTGYDPVDSSVMVLTPGITVTAPLNDPDPVSMPVDMVANTLSWVNDYQLGTQQNSNFSSNPKVPSNIVNGQVTTSSNKLTLGKSYEGYRLSDWKSFEQGSYRPQLGFLQFLIPAHTAYLSVNPIGGSSRAQVAYGGHVNLIRGASGGLTGMPYAGAIAVMSAPSVYAGGVFVYTRAETIYNIVDGVFEVVNAAAGYPPIPRDMVEALGTYHQIQVEKFIPGPVGRR